MAIKTFKTLDEQIEILVNKGLIINEPENTKRILLRENYFFINGYRHLFMKSNLDKQFISGTTFEELYSLFKFDRHLRNILFKYLLIIENNMKSIISYQLSKKYGYKQKEYLRLSNFNTDHDKKRQVNDLLRKMERQIRINGKQHSATSHYINNYGYLPLWVGVKVLSFGIICELYSVLKKEDQEEIAKIFDLDVESLLIYLPVLSNFRNLCAHEDILYDHCTQRDIPDTKYHVKLNIPLTNGEYIYGKNDLFALIIILKFMLTNNDFKDLMREVDAEVHVLSINVKTISKEKVLDKLGFPKNYIKITECE